MSKQIASSVIAAQIETLSAKLAALKIQFEQAVVVESAIAEGNTVSFYTGRKDAVTGERAVAVGVIVGLGLGGNQNRLAKIRVGSGFDEVSYSVRVTDVVGLVSASAESAAAADAAA